jgi:hypothetical protein
MSVHIGSIIKDYCDERRITAAMLSKMIGKDTSRVYRIFGRSHLDTDILHAYSVALKHNFFQYLWEEETKTSDTEVLRLKQEIGLLDQEVEELKRKNEMLMRENELLNKFLDKMKPA